LSKTLKKEILPPSAEERCTIVFKLRQENMPKVLHWSKVVNSLITPALDGAGKVKYHKDMWNDKNDSHEGLGEIMKTLNGDHLTKITQPPVEL
jgi:hypothetical protein